MVVGYGADAQDESEQQWSSGMRMEKVVCADKERGSVYLCESAGLRMLIYGIDSWGIVKDANSWYSWEIVKVFCSAVSGHLQGLPLLIRKPSQQVT